MSDANHWQYFADFCRNERAVGGPDPHMVIAGHLSKDCPLGERIWRGGCYVGTYNVPAAEALWQAWPWPTAFGKQEELSTWLKEHWEGIPTRRERRCVRTPAKMARYLSHYADWERALLLNGINTIETYEEAWERTHRLYAMGRYGAMKLLEFLHRYCGLEPNMPDIRAKGGDSPREALAMLYPDKAAFINGPNDEYAIAEIERIAACGKARLLNEFGIELDFYLFQVLLCDYKQSYKGQRQYPGRSHDSEIEYAGKVIAHFGERTLMYQARKELFPAMALGELSGWNGVRKELGTVLRQYGYTWSDLEYDYLSTVSLGAPAQWQS